MTEEIKFIFTNCKNNNLFYKFLTNTDVSIKLLEEIVKNNDLSDLSRIVFSILYCIREKNSYFRFSSKRTRFFEESFNKTLSEFSSNLNNENIQSIKIQSNIPLSECFTFIEVNNSLVSLILNGILNISNISQLSIEKIRRFPEFNRPEEVFYSEIFILIILVNQNPNFELKIKKLIKFNFLKDSPLAFYYAIAGKLFFIAIYFLFYFKGPIDTIKKVKKFLYKKCLKWEEKVKNDENIIIIFNYCLVCLSLLENITTKKELNINLIRILRRKILETKEIKNYNNQETFFVNLLSPNDESTDEETSDGKFKITGGFSHDPIHFGHIELYKICLGLTLLRPKSFHIKGKIENSENHHRILSASAFTSITYLFLIFYPIWPICALDQVEFHPIRNLIFLILEKKNQKYRFKEKKTNSFETSENFRRYIQDMLSDFAERNDLDSYEWKDLIKETVKRYEDKNE
ncbi:hypothetical protein M153_1634000260 [Pseudoloma neurophilia]|uniref:Uncharacterized protein n=1 Tax=Pseudoloma neurophilia TaxID=146866 RepID=A0A0R0M203_9MICR|nr:hypothetical protein M153_1634000260 [Pseudoloma neurophilia]